MDIQDRLRRYGRASRILGAYREALLALDADDPGFADAHFWLKRAEQEVNILEEALAAAGLMRNSDRYCTGEGK